MAVPKQKNSKTRGRKRRTHWKAELPNAFICSNCGESKLSHHICPHCGFYQGKEIISKVEEV